MIIPLPPSNPKPATPLVGIVAFVAVAAAVVVDLDEALVLAGTSFVFCFRRLVAVQTES